MRFNELQSELADHDAQNWLHAPGLETDDHNLVHAMKTLGGIADHVEEVQDRKISSDTKLSAAKIADLAIEAARFATNNGYDLEEIVRERLGYIRERASGMKEI